MEINFDKSNGLVPAIVQDGKTGKVLMLGYMNSEALKKTLETKLVTFYSRSKQRLWTKGEVSGNCLKLESLKMDCDKDTLLIKATPEGPTCHLGKDTCWGEQNTAHFGFLSILEEIIESRKEAPLESKSYVAGLFRKGVNAMAQKVGEEAVETIIEAKDNNDTLFLNEAADLLFHYLILLKAKGFELNDVVKVLETRHINS